MTPPPDCRGMRSHCSWASGILRAGASLAAALAFTAPSVSASARPAPTLFLSDISTPASGGTQLVVGDFNRDGRQDAAVATGWLIQVGVFIGKGNGAFRPEVVYPTGPYAVAL